MVDPEPPKGYEETIMRYRRVIEEKKRM